MQYLTVNDFSSFQLKWKEPTLIFIFGDFCSHCKTFKPEFAKFAKSMAKTNLKFGLIQIDSKYPDQQNLSKNLKNYISYSLPGVPAVLLYNNGKFVANFEGPRTVEGLRQFIGM